MMDIEWKHFEQLTSTSKWVKEHFAELSQDKITVVSAKEQTAGYGRRGHKWFSSPDDISITLAFKLAEHKENLAQLITLSVLKVLATYGLDALLKWPNDIMVKGKKIGGAICETTDDGVALGLGLNVNRRDFDQIDQDATSMSLELSQTLSIDEVQEKIALQFAGDLELYKTRGFILFYRDYNAHLYGLGCKIRVIDDGKELIGINEGIRDDGRLILKDVKGETHIVSSGFTVI